MHLLYIDPGSGSLLFQALLSGFLTVALFFKRILTYLKIRFRKKNDKNEVDFENIDNDEAN
jgi:hypothetical protein